jgi:hypothetical protein
VIPPGGGGSTTTFVDRLVTGADITLPDTGGTAWTPVALADTTLLELDLPAKVGDRVSYGYGGMRTGSDSWDAAIMVGDVQVMYLSTKSATPAADGDVSNYAGAGGPFFGHSTDRMVTLTDDLIDGSDVRFVMVSNGNGSSVVEADANNTFYMVAMNYGPAPS